MVKVGQPLLYPTAAICDNCQAEYDLGYRIPEETKAVQYYPIWDEAGKEIVGYIPTKPKNFPVHSFVLTARVEVGTVRLGSSDTDLMRLDLEVSEKLDAYRVFSDTHLGRLQLIPGFKDTSEIEPTKPLPNIAFLISFNLAVARNDALGKLYCRRRINEYEYESQSGESIRIVTNAEQLYGYHDLKIYLGTDWFRREDAETLRFIIDSGRLKPVLL